MQSLSAIKALQKQERARETAEIWEALADIFAALEALGASVPDIHRKRATDALLRAGRLSPDNLPDTELLEVAKVTGSRRYKHGMGQVFTGEAIEDDRGGMYMCTAATSPQESPGRDGGHFRRLWPDHEPTANTPAPEAIKWSSVKAGYTFAPGDLITDYGKTYRVTKSFAKDDQYRPPAAIGELYERVIL